jgi:hypothetical protein
MSWVASSVAKTTWLEHVNLLRQAPRHSRQQRRLIKPSLLNAATFVRAPATTGRNEGGFSFAQLAPR